LPPVEDGVAVEVERCVSGLGLVFLAGHQILPAEILGGRHVGIRIEPSTLMFHDLEPVCRCAPGRTHCSPTSPPTARSPTAWPPPRASAEPIQVQRRASATGVIMVAGQKIALGRIHAGDTVTVLVSETTVAIEFVDGDTKIVSRTTTQPVRSIKGQRPRTATSGS
jgi:hypothetical protein